MSWMSKVLSIITAAIVVNVLVEAMWMEVDKPLDLTTKIINIAWGSVLLTVLLLGAVESVKRS